MAHVLLPCDVPTWSEVERHLSQLRFAHSPEQLVADMQRIYDLCCVGLDPEDPPREEIRLDLLKRFLKSLSADESRRFFDSTLPALISCAMRLRELRPPGGFLYCLQQQDGMFALSRPFVASLLANSFFSTFPKRTSRTHPTLLDFNCSELFPFLDTPCHCEKLRSLFAYFDCTFQDEPEGTVYFCRQVRNDPSRYTAKAAVAPKGHDSYVAMFPLSIFRDRTAIFFEITEPRRRDHARK